MYRTRLIIFLTLAICVALLQWMCAADSTAVAWYGHHLFPLVQTARMTIAGLLPLSLGDILYTLTITYIIYRSGRYIYTLIVKNGRGRLLVSGLLGIANVVLATYLCFMLGWGINYYQPPLADTWLLQPYLEKADRAALSTFDSFLVARINEYAPRYRPARLQQVSNSAAAAYSLQSTTSIGQRGFGIKPSLYGFALQRTGIDGYYNPFTAEGQINARIPGYMLPFVVCHEMAHQAGIAAEDDANLVAYAICTGHADPSFRYSAYLNIWLYTNNRLYYLDSARARDFRHQLAALPAAHIDTLRQLAKLARNPISAYSSDLYDNYLKMQHQAEGIASYGHVIRTAWALEKQRAAVSSNSILLLP